MLTLDEDQRLLMDSARAAVAAHAPVSEYRKLREPQGEGFSREFWKLAAEMGWSGVLVPEAHGGAGFGVVGAGVVAREMARTLSLSPFLSTAVLAATALAEGGSAAQKEAWLPRIASARDDRRAGARRGAAAARALYATTARRDGAGFRLDGEKHFVLDGHVAEALIVAATIENVPALFLIEANAPGVSKQTRVLVDGRRVASVKFDGVAASETALLPGRALALDRTLDVARTVVAASLCGVAEEALRRTLDYLKQRRQFDRRIGSFQALQHRAALAHIAVENAWSATLQALQAHRQPRQPRRFRRGGGQVEGKPHGRGCDGGMFAIARRHRHDRRLRHRPLSETRARRGDAVWRRRAPRRPRRDHARLLMGTR